MPVYICRCCNNLLDLPDVGKIQVFRCPQCRSWKSYQPASLAEAQAAQSSDYRCPFCGAAKAPVWRRYWGRVSVLAVLLGILPLGLAAVFLLAVVIREAGKAIAGEEISRPLLCIGTGLAGGLLAVSGLLLFSLPWNYRRVCRDCGNRIAAPI